MDRRKSSLILISLVLMSTFYFALTTLPDNARATTLYVGGTGPGNYTTIQGAIDNASHGDTIFVYNGTYHEGLVINKTLSLKGEDRNTTIIETDSFNIAIQVSADWVNITRFSVNRGGMTSPIPGIFLDYASNCYIADNNISGSGMGILLLPSENNTVAHNNVSNNNFGIYLMYTNNSRIIGNTALNNEYNGIVLYYSNNNTIANNTASDNPHGILLSYSESNTLSNNLMVNDGIYIYGPSLSNWNTHTIGDSNTVNGKPVRYWKDIVGGSVPSDAGQVILANCTGVVVEDQNVSNGSVGVLLGFSSENTISNNTAYWNTWNAIQLFRSSRNAITNNIVLSNIVNGISLEESDNNTISDNNVSENRYGIRLYTSNGNTVARNDIHSNSDFGLDIRWSNGNTIAYNEIYSDRRHGISIGTSHLNFIHHNTVLGHFSGLGIYSSSGNTVVYNTVAKNQYGIDVYDCNSSHVHHNNFINNTVQATEGNSTDNNWNDGYPSGGNYWSDYTGVDNCSGPNQDVCPDPDGIGDTPYFFDWMGEDRYPLVFPVATFPPRPPTMIRASLSGANLENVTVGWSLSLDDGMGLNTVVGYEIYRNTTYDSEGLGYQLAASLPSGTSEFVDSLAGEGDPSDHFYRICALDTSNNTTCAVEQAAKSVRSLSRGFGLVSFPLIQSEESIETVLQSLSFDVAWYFDSLSQDWKSLMKTKPYLGNLQSLSSAMALWMNVTEDTNLTTAGVIPSSTTIHLWAGWNLVGFPSSKEDYTVADLKAAAGAVRVEGFDPTAPPYYLKVMQDSDVLQAGQGYWVLVNHDTTWTLSSS